jgi:threonine dehydrogenase-like Zn-dependent dehydrogenase
MLDSNGSNTTAAACIAKLMTSGSIEGKRAVVLAGTGPVGQRSALMLARAGAKEIILTSRQQARADKTAQELKDRFNIDVIPVEAGSSEERAHVLEGAHILVATGATGVELLKEDQWAFNPTLELVADANAAPPLGLGGIDMMDRGVDRQGKKVWGAIGFGTLKLAVHRACIAKLFETNTAVLNAEAIFEIAREMA